MSEILTVLKVLSYGIQLSDAMEKMSGSLKRLNEMVLKAKEEGRDNLTLEESAEIRNERDTSILALNEKIAEKGNTD